MANALTCYWSNVRVRCQEFIEKKVTNPNDALTKSNLSNSFITEKKRRGRYILRFNSPRLLPSIRYDLKTSEQTCQINWTLIVIERKLAYL